VREDRKNKDTGKSAPARSEPWRSRMRTLHEQVVVPELMHRFGYKNRAEVPRLEKVVLNMGVGAAVADPKQLDRALEEMALISGQRPVVTRAKRSISNFKIREGYRIGCKVTLRAERMYDFLDKLFNVVMPRIRDFQGVPTNSFDGRGNFAMGLSEQSIFPEIDYDKIDRTRGMNICICTTAKTDEESMQLLSLLGLPFRGSRGPGT
jgi:large subunit ribosomal protein L5